jgi:uncharacterized membrane protein YsdA (DUF1294 family)
MTGNVLRLGSALILLVVVLLAIALDRAPSWLPAAYAVVGLLSFGNYWVDKRAAVANRWRTPEAKLHGLDLVGGIVGGLLAQVALRHKTSKPAFGWVTAGIVALHLAGLILLLLGIYELSF